MTLFTYKGFTIELDTMATAWMGRNRVAYYRVPTLDTELEGRGPCCHSLQGIMWEIDGWLAENVPNNS